MASHELAHMPCPTQPQPTVLIVDDSATKRLALRAMLAPLGHAIVEVDSGYAALRAVRRAAFALILMDVQMPTLDGYQTATLIRRRIEAKLTPIIFVSGFGRNEEQTAAAYASGAVDFVSTPIRPDVLRAKVSVFIDLFVQSQDLLAQSEELRRSLDVITGLNAALRDSEGRTQAVLDNVTDGIFILDENGVIESVNRSVRRLFGYRAREPVGQRFGFVIAPERRAEFQQLELAQRRGSRQGRASREIETLGRREDQSTFAIEVEHGELVHGDRHLTLAVVRDISERMAHTAALEHLALHDAVTGLANRTLFADHASQALVSAKRATEPRAVLVMDLDGFKQINDTLGHAYGDTLLREVGRRVVSALREGDIVARVAGDRFAILPSGATDLVAAAAVAWKIQHACEAPYAIDGDVVQMSASIGIALYPEHGTSSAELLRGADLAMYDAKRAGSAYAVFDGAQETHLTSHLALLSDLRQCITRGELVLHYQPKVDLATRHISGVEALVRWRHPTRGLLAPGSFMPEAERIDLIEPLTRWVLNEALRQQRAWRDEGVDLAIAVNISATCLSHASTLPDTVAELAETWGSTLGRLTLELTERALIEPGATEILDRLHKMGAKLSIDDFGTEYSTLAYLQRLPVDEIKVDRSFVTGLTAGSDDEIIVRSTIELAHNLRLTVVAEGVEDQGVLEMLAAASCDTAQGYLFAAPCSAEELTAWMTQSRYGSPP